MKKTEIIQAIEYFETMIKVTEAAGISDPAELHRRTAIRALEEALEHRK